jgi:hypothetical protein
MAWDDRQLPAIAQNEQHRRRHFLARGDDVARRAEYVIVKRFKTGDANTFDEGDAEAIGCHGVPLP